MNPSRLTPGWGFSFGLNRPSVRREVIGDLTECVVELFLGHQHGLAKRKRTVHALPVAVDEDQCLVAPHQNRVHFVVRIVYLVEHGSQHKNPQLRYRF